MPYSGQGTFRVTTPSGSVDVTAADLRDWIIGGNLGPVAVPNATAYKLSEANSGRVHVVPDVSSTITITTPVPAAGLNYTLWYGGAAADAQNFVVSTGSDTNYFKGGVVFHDQNDDLSAPVYSNGSSNSKLTVVTPDAGCEVKIWCDGTLWYLNGYVHSATVPTLADQ
jgi:hypothetical protein